jgi:hypothetical protein
MTTILNMLSYIASLFLAATLAFIAANLFAGTIGVQATVPTSDLLMVASLAFAAQQFFHRETRRTRHAPAHNK